MSRSATSTFPPSSCPTFKSEVEACSIEIRAASAWNKAYDANLSTLNFEANCWPTGAALPDANANPLAAAAFCSETSEEEGKLDKAWEARERFIEAATNELGCWLMELQAHARGGSGWLRL